jgi:TonB family protein
MSVAVAYWPERRLAGCYSIHDSTPGHQKNPKSPFVSPQFDNLVRGYPLDTKPFKHDYPRNLKSSGEPGAPPSEKSPEEDVPGPARARSLGGRRVRAPDVIPGLAEVHGSLDREIVHAVMRRHISEVKYCYETELTAQADLSGRLKVQVTIAATGEVIASVLQSSTMGNFHVENCVVHAARRWKFPEPTGGGIVIVSYPFNFTPGSG